jgi:hypothetical protein
VSIIPTDGIVGWFDPNGNHGHVRWFKNDTTNTRSIDFFLPTAASALRDIVYYSNRRDLRPEFKSSYFCCKEEITDVMMEEKDTGDQNGCGGLWTGALVTVNSQR